MELRSIKFEFGQMVKCLPNIILLLYYYVRLLCCFPEYEPAPPDRWTAVWRTHLGGDCDYRNHPGQAVPCLSAPLWLFVSFSCCLNVKVCPSHVSLTLPTGIYFARCTHSRHGCNCVLQFQMDCCICDALMNQDKILEPQWSPPCTAPRCLSNAPAGTFMPCIV